MSAEEVVQQDVPVEEVPQKKGKQGKYRRDKRKSSQLHPCFLLTGFH